jgi:hypothetical protein
VIFKASEEPARSASHLLTALSATILELAPIFLKWAILWEVDGRVATSVEGVA